MAPVVPVVAAVAGSAAAGAGIGGALFGAGLLGSFGSAVIADSIFGFAVSAAVNQLGGRALAKKPKAQQFTQEASGRTLSLRSSVESHKVIYGTARVSGPLAFVATTDAGTDNTGDYRAGPNKFLHLVIPVAGHEVDSFTGFYLNDQEVTVDAYGWVTSAPYAKQSTRTTQVQTSKAVTSAVRVQNTTVTITTAAPHGFTAGSLVTIAGTNADLDGSFPVISASGNSFTITRYGGNNGPLALSSNPTASTTSSVTTTVTTSYARIKTFTGTDSQAASPELQAEVSGWSSDHRLRGIAYLHVRLEFHPDIYPLGIPNVSAVVKGKKVYDPRTTLAAWSDNAALCVRDYLTSDYGFGCAPSEINDTYGTAAANVCDESVPYSGGTTKRYTCNGVVDTASAPLDNLQSLVTSLAGAVTYVQGQFRVHAGAYDPPSGNVGIDLLAGDVEVNWRAGRKDSSNAVKGTYVDPNKNWQPTDFPPVTNPTYRAQDNGEEVFKDVELPFTNHPEAAQRLAKILLEKSRQQIRVTMPVNHGAMKYCVWDVVTLTNSQLGWSSKPFRVLRWNLGTPGPITLSLQEESSASYDWANGEATTVDPAPDTNLPNPLNVQAPGALTVTESLYVTRLGDGVKAKASLAWGASSDPFLKDYQPEYKSAAGTDWLVLPRTTNTSADVEDITPGGYDFRVKAVNNLGVSSDYATASKQMAGLLTPPSEPQNLTVSTIGGLAVLRWDLPQDLDVRIGGKVAFRHSPTETDGWGQSTTIGEAVAGGMTVAVLPLKSGVYLAKAVDSSGIESTLASGVTTDQATALEFANVTTLTEHPTFSGSKTNCFVGPTGLCLSGAGLFDAISSLDAVDDLDGYGGVAATGTYLFSGGIDLGSVRPIRLTSRLKATVFNQLDRIDARTAAIDDWLSFDGTTTASADARVMVRATDDDPAGSPAWGAWQRLDSAEFRTRAFQFKCVLTSDDPAYNIATAQLSVTADEVA